MGDTGRRHGFDEVQAHLPGALDPSEVPSRDSITRFEQIQADLGISRKVLTERLNHLVEQGVLERRPYDRRPRYEYLLTEKGTELVDLLMVMVGWGDRWLAGQAGPPVLYRHHACGQVSQVDLRCTHCGEPMHAADVELLPGPGAAV
jgi:DNA-binding HxlR family transcriptional regulator